MAEHSMGRIRHILVLLEPYLHEYKTWDEGRRYDEGFDILRQLSRSEVNQILELIIEEQQERIRESRKIN